MMFGGGPHVFEPFPRISPEASRGGLLEAARGWAMHTLDCHVGLFNRPDLIGSKQPGYFRYGQHI